MKESVFHGLYKMKRATQSKMENSVLELSKKVLANEMKDAKRRCEESIANGVDPKVAYKIFDAEVIAYTTFHYNRIINKNGFLNNNESEQ